MKTRTMKKALSLILAVLMIALAIPFTLLPAAAEEFSGDDFAKVTLYAQKANGSSVGFSDRAGMAIDKILHEEESYASAGGNNTTIAKRAYFDADGKIAYKDDGDYFGIIVVEFVKKTTLDSFTVWSPNGSGGNWIDNIAYDIYYSVDGITFVDSGVKTDNARTAHKLVPESDFPGTVAQNGTGTAGKVNMNEMDMNGITAKYIAIAVSQARPSSAQNQIILYEVTAKGTVYEEPAASDPTAVSFNDVSIFAQNGSGKTVYWGSGYDGDKALDKVLHEDNYSSARDKNNEITKRVYFDENGKIAYKDDADFYGVMVAELSTLTKLDTFTIWSPNGLTGKWIDNVAYDIYYSVDGVAFAPVEGASFDDSRTVLKGVSVDEFPGDATVCNDAGVIYRNDVDMKGVTAKYVAIAVRQPIPHDDGRSHIVLYEITAQGTAAAAGLEVGAAVRMDAPTGLRFTGTVNKNYVDGLKTQYGEDNVKLGMLITPTDYLTNNGLAFTKEALDACTAISGAKYLEIDAETVLTEGNNYKINCAIVEILEANYDRSFSAVLYIKVNGEIVEYSAFNELFNSRSVAEVAEAAYHDVKSEADTTYTNEVVVDGVTMYSPYTEDQRNTLYGFFG